MEYKIGDKVRLRGTKAGRTDGNYYRGYFIGFIGEQRKKGDVETITSIRKRPEFDNDAPHYFTNSKGGYFLSEDFEPLEIDWEKRLRGKTE